MASSLAQLLLLVVMHVVLHVVRTCVLVSLVGGCDAVGCLFYLWLGGSAPLLLLVGTRVVCA